MLASNATQDLACPPIDQHGFFNHYPRFLQTSRTDTKGRRMAYRHSALIEHNAEVIRGARILDLASHDGRWSFAAHKAGAAHVTGIEAKPELIQRAQQNMQHYGVNGSRYEFIQADCIEALRNLTPGSFDCVFCFGYLYHTLSHFELLRAISDLEIPCLLLDTLLIPESKACVHLAHDNPELEGAAVATSTHDDKALVGVPSTRALRIMVEHLGFELHYLDWNTIVEDPCDPHAWDGVRDYEAGRRHTLVALRERIQPKGSSFGSKPCARKSHVYSSKNKAPRHLVDAIPAVEVNGRTLTLGQVLAHAQIRNDSDFVENAIGHELVRAAAERAGITIAPEERERLREQFRTSLSQAPQPQLDPQQAAPQQANDIEGIDEQLDDCLRFGKLKGLVVGDKVDRLFAERREVLAQVALAQIVVAHELSARTALARINAGESFEAIARSISIDEDTAIGGGFMGRRTVASFASSPIVGPDLREFIRHADEGAISQPYKTGENWRIYKLLRQWPAELDNRTRSELHLSIFEHWLAAERAKAQVHTNLWKQLS